MVWSKEEYEKYAITALNSIYPEFQNMTKSESPDYHNATIGVEITRAIIEKFAEIDAFWKKNQNKKYDDLPKKQLTKMGFDAPPFPLDSQNILYGQRSPNGGSFLYLRKKGTSDLLLCTYFGKPETNEFTVSYILKAIEEKLTKLNKNYTILQRNDLCIMVQHQLNYYFCQDEIVNELLNFTVSSIKAEYMKWSTSIVFDSIFLLFLDNLFCINTHTWMIERNTISQKQINDFCSTL